MKTQHPNVHQYLKDILKILSQRISGDFINKQEAQRATIRAPEYNVLPF